MDEFKKDTDEKEELLKRCISAEERAKYMESELGKLAHHQKEIQQLNAENAILLGRVEKLGLENNMKNRQIDELFKKWDISSLNLTLKENMEYMVKLDA